MKTTCEYDTATITAIREIDARIACLEKEGRDVYVTTEGIVVAQGNRITVFESIEDLAGYDKSLVEYIYPN